MSCEHCERLNKILDQRDERISKLEDENSDLDEQSGGLLDEVQSLKTDLRNAGDSEGRCEELEYKLEGLESIREAWIKVRILKARLGAPEGASFVGYTNRVNKYRAATEELFDALEQLPLYAGEVGIAKESWK